jgi:HPt (histidine-containing phosphotransfer) domain-containing protein
MRIDIEYLKSAIDDDPEFLVGVLETFEKDLEQTLPEFKALLGGEDVYLMGRKAHKLLSSSQLFGLTEFSEELKKLEMLSDEGDVAKCNSQLKVVTKLSEDCISGIIKAKKELR